MKSVLFKLIFFFFFIGIKAQTTYYVSLNGNDNNDGLSEATAWRTIGYAASASSPVTSGDTVYIKAGDYGNDAVYFDKNYSPSDARISFIGYQNTPGDIVDVNFNYGDSVDPTLMPLINPGDRTTGDGITFIDTYAITLKNFQISNCLMGIYVWNNNPIDSNLVFENIFLQNIGWEYSSAIGMKDAGSNTIKNCLIVNATGAGMDLGGNNNLIEDCKVYSDETQIIYNGSSISMDYYIVLKGDNNIVRNCYAERIGDLDDVGHGLEIKESGHNNLFVDCTVKNMIAGCFSVRWSDVQNNEFRNCRAIGGISTNVVGFMIREGASNNVFNACVSENCEAGIRFILAGEDEVYCGENNVFNNCIIKNSEWVIDMNQYYYNSAPVDNNLLINCTIDNSNYLVNCDRPNAGNQLINCIISNVNNLELGSYPNDLAFGYCDFYNNGFALPAGTANISDNPLFVDASSGDYHLQETSPCIDAGTTINAPDVDYDGVLRPQGNGIDIGAYEYSTNSGILTHQTETISIYPNPTNAKIFLSEKYTNSHYQLLSSSGQILKDAFVLSNTIDLSDFNAGIYFIKLDNAQQKVMLKIIKK